MLICLVLLLLAAFSQLIKPVQSKLDTVLTPIHDVASAPAHVWARFRHLLQSRSALEARNARLQKKVLRQQVLLQQLATLQHENRQLRTLLKMKPAANTTLMVGQVIGLAPNAFQEKVLIDQGSHNGIKVGQPVFDAYGLFGQVVSVNEFSSWVLQISDKQSAVPVVDNRNGLRGIVQGRGQGVLQWVDIAKTADVREGDLLMTSGLGGRYPKGYPVGKIVQIKKSPGQAFDLIAVVPIAHLKRSRYILVLR